MTSVQAKGKDGDVAILFIITKRKKTNEILQIIKKYNPNAIYSIENVTRVSQPVFYGQIDSPRRLFRRV